MKPLLQIIATFSGLVLICGCPGQPSAPPTNPVAVKEQQPATNEPAEVTTALPDWSLDPAKTDQLAPPVKLSGFEFRPPQGFTRVQSESMPEGTALWVGPIREDETYTYFIVIAAPLPEELSKLPMEDLLNEVLGGVREARDEWNSTAIERGRIHDVTFVRVRWSGIARAPSREGLVGTPMHGFVYLTVDSQEVIQILCHDVAPYHAESLESCETAVRAMRRIQE